MRLGLKTFVPGPVAKKKGCLELKYIPCPAQNYVEPANHGEYGGIFEMYDVCHFSVCCVGFALFIPAAIVGSDHDCRAIAVSPRFPAATVT